MSDNPYVILLLINAILLMVGTFMDMTPAVLIFTPVFLPVMTELAPRMGVAPGEMAYVFGIVIVFNLSIGLCTPPVGTILFVGCGVGRVSITDLTRPLLPFFAAMVAALALVATFPGLTLWLPRDVFGLIR